MSEAGADPAHPEPEAGRVVLVTGGNRGIGRAIAEAFLAQGDRVAVTTRSGGAPDGALDVRCDVTDPAAVDAAFAQIEAELGPVEVLVANAGITADTLVLRMSEDDWSSVIDTNLTGSFRLAKRAAKGMLRLRRGRIIFISSVVGLLGSPGQVNYAASKAGLVGMARSLARELGSRSITANVVAPGFVDTDMTAVLTDEQKAAIKTQVPLGRYADPAEVAGTVTFLASDAGAYITGAVIPVDGGLGMGH
ncbi:MAG: beta-ketoacyl-ACP reductase [Nocardioides sp.]